jgi:Zn-dependent protease with chaperone function
MKRNILFVIVLSLVLTTQAMSAPDIVNLALHGLGGGAVDEMKDRILSLPFTVFGAEDRRNAISALPNSIREARITEGKLLRRVELITRPVLELHGQANKVEVFLYQDHLPRVLVWRGCILAISDSLAEPLYDGELAGIVAHELGHAYFTAETLAARKAGDDQTLRVVELKCDAVGMLTLKLLERNPADLLKGLRRFAELREKRGYYPREPWSHPSMMERAQFSQRFLKQLV